MLDSSARAHAAPPRSHALPAESRAEGISVAGRLWGGMRLARRATPTFVVADEDPFHPPELEAISMRPLPDADGERGDGRGGRDGAVVAPARGEVPSAARDAEAAKATTEAADPATE